MAIRWNDIKAQRAVRERSLAATPEPVAEPTPINESVSNIVVNGATSAPSWRILGVSPIAADPISGEVPEPEPIERFPARSRGITFEPNYQDLNPVLDAEFISVNGLTGSPSGSWVGYYPGLSSSTQVGKSSLFTVGQPSSFDISTPPVPLDQTAYRQQIKIYGEDTSTAGTRWSGTITDIINNRIYITVNSVSRTIQISDPTQKWNIANVPLGSGVE